MPEVLFLAYHYPPIGGGGVQRAVKIVRYLPEFGCDPVVVTGPGGATGLWTPADELLGGEIPPETRVVRVPGPVPGDSEGPRRKWERLSGRPTPYDRWWVGAATEAGMAAGKSADVILGELVPYVTAEAASRVAAELGKPWVADLQDPWALDEMWVYPTWLHRRADRDKMRRLLNTAAAIVMNTPEAVVRLLDAFPELAEKPVVSIPNGLDSGDFAATPPRREDGRFRIVHSGYLHAELGLRHRKTRRLRKLLGGMPLPEVDYLTRSHYFLLQAVQRVLAADPSLSDVIEIHLAGVVSETDRQIAAESSVTRFSGYLTHPETLELVQSADLLFLPMQDLPEGTRAGLVPGKTYEYLGAGRPILAALPDGDARDLLEEAGNALLCRPADVEAMADRISQAVQRWRSGEPLPAPRPEVVARYERRRQTGELASLLEQVAGHAAAGRAPAAAAPPIAA